MAPRPTGPAPQPPPDLPADTGLSDTMANYLRTFALWCRNMFNDKLPAHAALPGIILSGFNAAGNNPNVYLLQVGNGGTLWLTPVALGTGKLGTAFIAGSLNFLSLTGVVDGSSAPAGQIGEYLTAGLSNVSIPANAWTAVCSIVLTPGDWDLWGQLSLQASAGANNLQGGITTTPGAGAQDMVILLTGTSSAFYGALRSRRVSITVPTTYWISCYLGFGSGTGTAGGGLYARRMR